MDFGTLLSAVQTLFAAMECSKLKDLCSILDYKSELDNLKSTVHTVKAVLDDAESVQDQEGLLSQTQLYVDELKDVVYDAEDLLDEFVTVAKQNKLIKGGSLYQKVRLLFSRFDSLGFAWRMSKGVKEIRQRLDTIANNHRNFAYKFDHQPIRRRRDTCSYVYAQDVIGRKDDVENIVARLLDPDTQRDVSCLTIVGIGGLGKTTLAQLVFNDPRIEKEFSLKSWTCVSDESQKHLDVRTILGQILQSITHGDYKDLEMESLQKQLEGQLVGKKFFLVLDDVWTEDRFQWLDLEKFLMKGLRGSWILVTTRSEKTAIAVGSKVSYQLKGLSDEDSWHLFEITAFGERGEQAHSSNLVEVGQQIVKRCANVPLAIKVMGSLLYGQGEEKWILFQKTGLGKLKSGNDGGIEPILKLSYHHLDSSLKACFSYCALFHKDELIKKEMLINLWMAQDYVAPLYEGQSIEDAAEEYFSILMKRCFFQDITKDEYGNIDSCKVHDLMHDIAQEVAGKEVHTIDDATESLELDHKIRHLNYDHESKGMEIFFTKTKIRTCLNVGWRTQPTNLDALLSNWTCLRALDLSGSRLKSLSSTIGKLLHLRYLDLSHNSELEMLPKSITKLHNLQTLCLQNCQRLKELPEGLTDLIKLRVLDIEHDFFVLQCMPHGMGKLSCLQKLPMFVVGDQRNSTLKQNIFDQLKDLKALTSLKGCLHVKFPTNFEYAEANVREGGYIGNKEHLNRVGIMFSPGDIMLESRKEELLLEDLQPHSNVKELILRYYKGTRMPCWAREDQLTTFLPNLVTIVLEHCSQIQQLPLLRKLQHLKSLVLEYMSDLEYMECTSTNGNVHDGTGASRSEIFFPSLKKLYLGNLPKLKGWWRENEIIDNNTGKEPQLLPSFPCLSYLGVPECPNLTCIPTCPAIEECFTLGELNEKLRIMNKVEYGNSKLRSAQICKVASFKTLFPVEAFGCLHKLCICGAPDLEKLFQVEEVFRMCSSSLVELSIGS